MVRLSMLQGGGSFGLAAEEAAEVDVVDRKIKTQIDELVVEVAVAAKVFLAALVVIVVEEVKLMVVMEVLEI